MAGSTIFRFFRFLRSMCAPITACIGFSCLLTFIFILYQPTHGPGGVQRLGWQSWDLVGLTSDAAATDENKGSASESLPAGVDWWNVTAEAYVDIASLPLDKWTPLLPHDTGLSELAIEPCIGGPAMASLCFPKSTKSEDALKGKWVRVDRDLNRQVGYWYLNIYYRRTRRLDVPLITDIKLLPEGESPQSTPAGTWTKVIRSLRDGWQGEPPLYLWYMTSKTGLEMTGQEAQDDLITELDILYGSDRPWYGFEKYEPSITLERKGKVVSEWLTYRKGVHRAPPAPPLHFSRHGKFKILQVADLHFSVAHTDCRDSLLSPCSDSDNLTSTLLGHVMDKEKPDLVVFTGDQLNGQGTSWDPKSVLAKFSVAVADRGVPWAAIFGNHDDEDGAKREAQVKLLQALPYSLVERGPKDIHGVGNYVLKVKSADASKTHLLTLYFLDSGSYVGYLNWLSFVTPTEYDYLHQDQIDWFLKESASISQIERPFTPDGAKDLSGLWDRQSGQITPTTKKLAKPNALMFFHMPLEESYQKADSNPATGEKLDVGFGNLEASGAAKKNEGFFEKAVMTAMESDHLGTTAHEVKVIGNGHCHVTENCKRVKGVWLCFGGGGSYSGYGRIGFDRRFRIYDISDFGETIRTYKRTENDNILNEMILAGRGAPPPYESRP